MSVEQRRGLIEPGHGQLSIVLRNPVDREHGFRSIVNTGSGDHERGSPPLSQNDRPEVRAVLAGFAIEAVETTWLIGERHREIVEAGNQSFTPVDAAFHSG